MKLNAKSYVALLALFAVLAISFSAATPTAYAWGGLDHHQQNQVSINSVSIDSVTFNGQFLIVKVSVTINHDDHGYWQVHSNRHVTFTLTVSYGQSQLDPRHDGTKYFRGMATADLTKQSNGDWYAQATFSVPYKGYYYYLFQLDARDPTTYNWIGADWVDPREGTAPQ